MSVQPISNHLPTQRFIFNSDKITETINKIAYPIILLLGLASISLVGYFLSIHTFEIASILFGSGIVFSILGLKNIKSAFEEYTSINKKFDLSKKLPPHLYEKKWFCYQKLTKNAPVNETVDFYKIRLNQRTKIKTNSLFNNPKMSIQNRNGGFRYDKSSATTEHWTANFADCHLFGFAEGPLLAQDELQVLEHPGIYHLKGFLNSSTGQINNDEIALVKGIKRKGQLKNIYGNAFASKPIKDIDKNLSVFDSPVKNNIFAIVAPVVQKPNTPYTKSNLEDLFYRSNTAFKGIKKQANNKKVVCHTGNWGAGAFGGSVKAAVLCQLAAADEANIDEIIFYPMDKQKEFQSAKTLYTQIKKQYPNLTTDEFLTHLANNAIQYNLIFKSSNGT